MRFELNMPPGDRQRSLMDHFNAALREKMQEYGGSSQLSSDDTFLSITRGRFRMAEGSIPLIWRMSRHRDGTLSWIEVCPADAPRDSGSWEWEIKDFVLTVMASALSNSKAEFFHDSLFYYIGPPLDGEYWLPGFRLAPAIPGDTEPEWWAERIVSISFSVCATDRSNAGTVAQVKAARIAARLSLILNVGFYERVPERRWVEMPVDNGGRTEAHRLWLGLTTPELRLSSMPNKEEVCPLGAFDGSLDRRNWVDEKTLSMPPETRAILRGFDGLEPAVSDALDRAARLTQVALVVKPRYPSVALAYQVAAIEAIAKSTGQFTGFSDFVRRNIPYEADLTDILETLYGRARSGHFHAGEFPVGEFDSLPVGDPFFDPQVIQRMQLRSWGDLILRRALVSWMRTTIPELRRTHDEPCCPTA